MAFFGTVSTEPLKNKIPGLLRTGTQELMEGIIVSALISEEHDLRSDITKQAIEDGSPVTDHVIIQPAKITVAFDVSNTQASGFLLSGGQTPRDTFEAIRKIWLDRIPINFYTEHFLYTNMIVTRFTPVHSAPFKGRIQGRITLEELNIVSPAIVGRQPQDIAPPEALANAAVEHQGIVIPEPLDGGILVETWDALKPELIKGAEYLSGLFEDALQKVPPLPYP